MMDIGMPSGRHHGRTDRTTADVIALIDIATLKPAEGRMHLSGPFDRSMA